LREVPTMSATLTTSERRDLETLEGVVQRGLDTFIEVGQALAEIRDRRLYRQTHGTFEAYCQEKWRLSRTRAYQLIDAAAVSTTVDSAGLPPPANEAQARELVPALREDEQQVVEVWRELREEFGEDVTANRVKRLVTNRFNRIRRERAAENPPPVEVLPQTVDIRHCDIRELAVEPGSIDLVLTDPPYNTEALDSYDLLADFAAEALRPGGWLVAYTGNNHLLDAAKRLERRLRWRTLAGVYMPGSHTHLHAYRCRVQLKPLVVFSRGEVRRPRCWWTNVMTSERPSKHLHPWQQSEGDLDRLIEALSPPGGLICDPFLGSGTTAAVAHRLGRRFIGCDVDPNAVAVAQRRLASSKPEPRDDLADYAEAELERVRAKFGEAS
jgi:hypothetical protein